MRAGSPRTGLLALVSFAALLVVLAVVSLDLLRRPGPPPVTTVPGTSLALTRHVVLVVVDGLRFDYANDPDRAPNIARHMREETHGEVWAGQITMSSAAVLAMGAGQRGDFTEVAFNLDQDPTPYDHLFGSVARARLRSALAGDVVWSALFGKATEQRTAPPDLALDADDSAEILASAHALAQARPRPNFLVAHVTTPDHQAHAHGAASDSYRTFLRAFDARLEAFLHALPEDSTVVVLSDHGALDSGAHGMGSETERRSPIFAYGPGIARGRALAPIEQVDLAPTFAALLGVSTPIHARGTAAFELLDLAPTHARDIACNEAARLGRLVNAAHAPAIAAVDRAEGLCASPASVPAEIVDATRKAARSWDQALDEARSRSGRFALAAIFLVMLGTAAVAVRLVPRVHQLHGIPRVLAAVVVLAIVSVALNVLMDHLPRPLRNIRGALTVVFTLPIYLSLLAPEKVTAWFARRKLVGFAMVPAFLAASYPLDTKVHGYLALAVIAVVWMLRPDADLKTPGPRLPAIRIGAVLAAVAVLASTALGGEEVRALPLRARLPIGLSLAAAWLALGARDRDRGSATRANVLSAIFVACAGVLAKPLVPSTVGLIALLASMVAALVFARRGQATLACGFAFGAYGLVSRDVEVYTVAAAALLVEALAHAASTHGRSSPEERPWALATLTLGLFLAGYLVRVGVQQGLGIGGADLDAGVFGDHAPSMIRIALCVVAKYVLVSGILVYVFAQRRERMLLASLLFASVLWAGRAAVLSLGLFVSRISTDPLLQMTPLGSYFNDLPCITLIGLGFLVGLGTLGAEKPETLVLPVADPAQPPELAPVVEKL